MNRNTTGRLGWLDVDLGGLEKILVRRGKEFLIFELIQNAWDAGCTVVDIRLPAPKKGKTQLVVTDDSPQGFQDLSHAFTLFAESSKKGSPTLRGLFNAGEKFVLAFCEHATIVSTKGGLAFDNRGRRRIRKRTTRGSEFNGLVKLGTADWECICKAVRTLIPPVKTVFNGELLPDRQPIHAFDVDLPTVTADEDGRLKRSLRTTELRIYEPLPGEVASLYELGLPIVATGDKWHVDVQQKVPLNLDRDNVSPSYLQSIRVAVVNAMAERFSETDAASPWVRQAAGDSRIQEQAFNRTIDLRFGPDRATYDPSDREANLIAVSKGITVISPASLSADEWENVRRFGSSLPAGRVTPSPKPFAPNGRPLRILETKHDGHHAFERFAVMLAQQLIDRELKVTFADDPGWLFRGCYGAGTLTVNVKASGDGWFLGSAPVLLENWIPFLIHEFAHDRVSGHLTEAYHVECCRLAGLLARRLYEQPQLFGFVLRESAPQ